MTLFLCVALFLGLPTAGNKSDREQDNLKGPVGSVRVERAEISRQSTPQTEGKRVRSHKIRYSEKGEMLEMIHYQDDFISKYLLLASDADGNKQVTVYLRSNPNVLTSPSTSGVFQAANTSQVFRHLFKYDAKGNRTEDMVYAADGTLTGKELYGFDDQSNNIEVNSYDEMGVARKTIFTYDSKGKVATSTIFNELGKQTDKRSYVYELDAQGNWIKRTASRILANGKAEPIEVLYRTISYYPPVGNYQEGGVVGGISNEDAEKNKNANIVRKTGGVLAGSAIRQVAPVYPPLAKAARISGAVIVEVVLDDEGDVLMTRTLQGHPLLKDSAERAAQGWKFTPTSLDGMPVRVVGTLTFNFNL